MALLWLLYALMLFASQPHMCIQGNHFEAYRFKTLPVTVHLLHCQSMMYACSMYLQVQQHEAMRSSEAGAPSLSAGGTASSSTWDAVMVLCSLVSDMVRLAAYDSRMHAVLLEAVATHHSGEQWLAGAHLAAVPQHLPPGDLLQQAEDVAYHLQQHCSSNASSSSSSADAPWMMAAEELAAALAHPGPHIRKVLEKLQFTAELLTGGSDLVALGWQLHSTVWCFTIRLCCVSLCTQAP
jgi:hypothetical protein